MNMPFKAAQDCATAALHHYLPEREDMVWLTEVVDKPRFGWDWPALEKGFFKPMRDWALQHNARLKPVLAGLLIDALGGDKRQHPALLAALEFSHLASCMLDDVHNGRDLSASVSESVAIPLPVWVTLFYNARQLAPVLVLRSSPQLSLEQRMRLIQHYLFQHSLGVTMDLWGAERKLTHRALNDFVAYLKNGIGAPGFGLAAATAAAALGLDEKSFVALRQMGTDLGVSLRLNALSQGETRAIRFAGRRVAEPEICWRMPCDAPTLLTQAQQLRESALSAAHRIAPEVGDTVSDFLDVLDASVSGEKLS